MANERKDYGPLAATATRLVTKFGRPLVFKKYNTLHNRVTSKDEFTVEGTENLTGVIIENDKSLITGMRLDTGRQLFSGSRLNSTRLLVLLTPEIAPSMGWKFDADAVDPGAVIGIFPGPVVQNGLKGLWSIMKINELKPAGVTLLYELEIEQ